MSFNLDFSQIWSQASDFINNLWPVFVIPIGLVLGAGILGMIVKEIKGSISGL